MKSPVTESPQLLWSPEAQRPAVSSPVYRWLKQCAPASARQFYRQARLRARALQRRWFLSVAHCSVRNKLIHIGISSELEHSRADTYGTKEPETLDWLDHNLKPKDILFDIGANIGLYSLYAASLRSDCQIYAFEPESQNFARLCQNVLLNKASGVIPCNLPLSDRERFDYFYVNGDIQAGGSEHAFGQPHTAVLRQGALAVTLDSLIRDRGLPTPNLLKIDVDGLEEAILRGAENTLNSATLRTVLVELNIPTGSTSKSALEFMESCGYRVTQKSGWMYIKDGIQSQNFIFHKNL